MVDNFVWRGEPIHNVKQWCRHHQQDMLTIECRETWMAPEFSREDRPDLYTWVDDVCDCCGQTTDDGYWDYTGPMKKVIGEPSLMEAPAIIWDNRQLAGNDRRTVYTVIKREIP